MILQCSKCKKPFSVAMLDESKTPGQTICVFCRMEDRPTIWSVVDSIVKNEEFEEDIDDVNKETEKNTVPETSSGTVIHNHET